VIWFWFLVFRLIWYRALMMVDLDLDLDLGLDLDLDFDVWMMFDLDFYLDFYLCCFGWVFDVWFCV
jgi:hypothetical protein